MTVMRALPRIFSPHLPAAAAATPVQVLPVLALLPSVLPEQAQVPLLCQAPAMAVALVHFLPAWFQQTIFLLLAAAPALHHRPYPAVAAFPSWQEPVPPVSALLLHRPGSHGISLSASGRNLPLFKQPGLEQIQEPVVGLAPLRTQAALRLQAQEASALPPAALRLRLVFLHPAMAAGLNPVP